MHSLWQRLSKPFFLLAPMADVTDPAYRSVIAEISHKEGAAPYVTWTEFVSADGLYHTREKKKMLDNENPLVRDLEYGEGEHPVIAQFFGSNPETMEYAAAYALAQGFDGVDINMGCPDKSIEKQGAGAAHIKDPLRAREIIRAAIKGTQGKIPVSVKTRLGFNQIEYTEWFPHLLAEDIALLTVHLRTRKEMSKVAAHWEYAGEIARFVRGIRSDVLLAGNGDVQDLTEAKHLAKEHTLDGIMLGRAIFGNPWLFTSVPVEKRTKEERLQALLLLAERFERLSPAKHYALLKKHFKAFVQGFEGAAELRSKLMETSSVSELKELIA